ncbi:MAG: flagellar hook-associated protein 3 [Deltaproteobacteria bacterium]|nr:flagellar hook-associated protein 3 [Deltaproteobacteria bacterium]
MRVTSGMLVNDTLQDIKKAMERLKKSQDLATTLKKVAKPSDDPVAAERLVILHATKDKLDQYSRNLERARAFADQTDSSLSQAVDILSKAKELAVSGLNSGLNASELSIKGKEAEQLKKQMITISDSKLGNEYIFSGYKLDAAPFDQSGNYTGDDGSIELDVGPGTRTAINESGQKVFVDGHVFDALESLKTALEGADREAVRNALDDIDNALNHVLQVHGRFGARASTLDQVDKDLESRKVELAGHISSLEDADFAEAATGYMNDLKALEAAMKITERTLGVSIVNLLG